MPKTPDTIEVLHGQKEYQKLVDSLTPKPKVWINLLRAFVVGGIICAIGQGVLNFFMNYGEGMDMTAASAPTFAVMIFLGALLTGLNVYHDIGEFGGAGAAIPITGFANTVASAAMEFKREGFVLGMAAKMFVIAGPVIVYALLSGVTVAAIKWLVF